MDIKEDEVKEIKKLGTMHGSDVKLVTLKGGFHIGLGKKKSNSKKSEILAAGSHPALVSHQISKKYDKNFQEVMSKNEKDTPPEVSDFSHNLSSSQKNVLGLDIYCIKKNENIEFNITKHNFEIFSVKATETGDEIILEKTEKNAERLKNIDKLNLSKNLQKTITEYAKSKGLKIKKEF